MQTTSVSIHDAITSGALGPFSIGTTRDDIGLGLGQPTDASIVDRNGEACIWRYGFIEFHFNRDVLNLIHCDADELFAGGANLSIDPWKLRRSMPLNEVMSILDGNNLRYNGCSGTREPECTLRLDSGFCLGFVLDRNVGLGPTGLRSWSIQSRG